MDPFYSLTGRKVGSPRYSDIIRAEAPTAREAYYSKLSRDLEQKRMDQQKELYEKELTQNQSQFQENLDTQKQQYGETLKLQQEQGAEAQKQAALATGVSSAGLAIQSAPYIKSGVGSVAGLFSEGAAASAAPAATTVAPAAAESALVGTGGAGAASSVGATGGAEAGATAGAGGALGTTAAIGAIIAGQHALSKDTDREYKGIKTGDVFSTNDEGNWEPRFFTEPWMGWAEQSFDRPTAGERFDSAVLRGDWGDMTAEGPAMVNQWANPIGVAGYDFLHEGIKDFTGADDRTADVIGGLIDPISAGANLFSDVIDDVSWLCTETGKIVGIEDLIMEKLEALKHYSKKNHHRIAMHYFVNAPKLVKAIKERLNVDLVNFYNDFKQNTIAPIMEHMESGDFEEAHKIYEEKYLALIKQYAPELYPCYSRTETPEVQNA